MLTFLLPCRFFFVFFFFLNQSKQPRQKILRFAVFEVGLGGQGKLPRHGTRHSRFGEQPFRILVYLWIAAGREVGHARKRASPEVMGLPKLLCDLTQPEYRHKQMGEALGGLGVQPRYVDNNPGDGRDDRFLAPAQSQKKGKPRTRRGFCYGKRPREAGSPTNYVPRRRRSFHLDLEVPIPRKQSYPRSLGLVQ